MTSELNEMSINNSEASNAVSACVNKYEEFEDISEYDNPAIASTDKLLPECKTNMKEFLTNEIFKNDDSKVEKLGIEEVRWFYQTGKKKKWKPFIGNDSISIESEWRCISKSDSDIQRVSVRGGMYEVDVLERKCFPVYWSSINFKGVEDSVDIIRGTWFHEANFMPLNEELADRIEQEHIERWKGLCMDEIKIFVGDTAMHSVKLPNCHVDWYTVNDVYMHSDAVSYRALRNIVQKFGASKTSTSGSKLRRGYREDAMHEDCMPPVDHLVFVVHGIGAKTDRHKIVRNTSEFRATCNRVAAKQYAHFTGRVEFLPVEWRSKLILDNGIVDTLTPRRTLGLRQFLNNNVMDILYYTSPLYRGEIVTALRNEIIRIHGMFMERNSNFHGKISIFAHSLGTVIMHDIMTGWSPESLFEEYLKKEHENVLQAVQSAGNEPSLISTNEKLESDLTEIKIAQAKLAHIEADVFEKSNPRKGLGFTVENFFCVGSPLAVFLSLRGQRPSEGLGSQDDILPRTVCRRIFNIYHPFDPIAYRFEPLILSHYGSIAPLQVHWHNAIHKTSYGEMPSKPYTAETTKEMTNVQAKEPSIDADAASMETSDPEGSLEHEYSFDDKEYNGDKNDINDPTSNTTNDSADASPRLVKRASYLKSLSGSAFKMGKAIWVKARGSNSANSKDADEVSIDASLVSEEEVPVPTDIGSLNDNASISSVESSSQSPMTAHREFRRVSSVGGGPLKSKLLEQTMPYDTDPTLNPATLEYRLDYELQEGFTESRLGYASLTSHTSYWSSQDVALFVLMQIHPQSAMSQSLRS